MTQAIGRINTTYAYHPANQNVDIVLPTDVVAHYAPERPGPLRGDFAPLEFSIKNEGVQSPLMIATDGVYGVLTNGFHRLRIAQKLGLKELPVQIVPDNMRRMSMKYGLAALESTVTEWAGNHLWAHTEHEVIRRKVGARVSSGGIPASVYLRCDCSCGASWKEEG